MSLEYFKFKTWIKVGIFLIFRLFFTTVYVLEFKQINWCGAVPL